MSKRTSKEKKKPSFDDKLCPVCKKIFSWRKKWERDWNKVIYCSKLCQNKRNKD